MGSLQLAEAFGPQPSCSLRRSLSRLFTLAFLLGCVNCGQANGRVSTVYGLLSPDSVRPPACSDWLLCEQLAPLPLWSMRVRGLERALPVCEALPFFQARQARQLLAHKRVLMLGDSTMEELAHDLVMLLADLNGKASEAYLTRATSINEKTRPALRAIPVGRDGGIATIHYTHRNMSADFPAHNISLVHRFTGHPLLDHIHFGIATFESREFANELSCLLGETSGCMRPDVVVVNSGLHDYNTTLPQFEATVVRLAARLRRLGVRVVWLGNHDSAPANVLSRFLLPAFDEAAFRAFSRLGHRYVNTSRVIHQVTCLTDSETVLSNEGLHYGGASRPTRVTHSGI